MLFRSLQLQGGRMSASELTDFEEQDFYREALQLRIWDEAGKSGRDQDNAPIEIQLGDLWKWMHSVPVCGPRD